VETLAVDVVISDMAEVMLKSNLSHGTLGVSSPGMPFNFMEKAYRMNRDVAWKGSVGIWLRQWFSEPEVDEVAQL
jgi:hypothetical protein